ncbi:MAG TPA: rod shape-determining protein MreC [Actinomycetota bacterium]
MFDRQRRLRLLLLTFVLASITIVTIDFRTHGDGPLDRLGRVAMTVIGPLQEGLSTIFRPVGNFFGGIGRIGSLQADIELLERENAELRAQQEAVEDITRENASLRRLLVLRDRFNLRTAPAQVIGVSPSNFERVVFINRGSADGVRKDMPVLAGEGLAGRVVEVGETTSKVLLVVDRASAVAARLASNGKTGILEGTGGATVRFELLDPEAEVEVGDRVLTSGYDGGVFPPGLPLGTVVDAPPPHSALSRVVTVQPFVDFSSLDYVLLVTSEERGG